MAISLDRKTPGVFGIIFGAVVSITLGALLAVIHLISQTVEVVATAPKEPVLGVRYLVKGEAPKDSGKALERKRDMLDEAGSEVAFTEGELNAWAQTIIPMKVEDAEKAGSMLIIAGRPNFRMIGSELQVGMENELVFFGNTAPLVAQGRGTFARVGQHVRFQPSEAYVGALPLHRLPSPLSEMLVNRLGFIAPEGLASVLDRASAIEVADGQLTVRLR